MDTEYIHSAMGFSVILAYLVAVLFSVRPLERDKFQKLFKNILLIILFLVILLFFVPNHPNNYYREFLVTLIIFSGGAMLHVSARRYMQIGGSRWNCFVPYIHFSEFIRLWWEEPQEDAEAAAK